MKEKNITFETVKPKNTKAFRTAYDTYQHLENPSIYKNPEQEKNCVSYYPFGMTMSGLSFIDVDDEDKNLYLFNGKELQTEFGYENYDYGARHFDAQLGRWHVIDPMAESYYSQSPYHFSGNNPIYFVDNNGMNYDGYIVDEYGKIERVDNTGGDKYDVLYTKKDYEKEKESGETNEYGNPEPENSVTVNDTDILPNLSEVNDKGNSISKSHSTGSIDDVFKVFKFAADNTSAEWGLARYKENNTNKYAIFTNHCTSSISSPQDYGLKNTIAFVHSHPNAMANEYDELMSMGGERRWDTGQWQRYLNSDWGHKASGYRPFEFYTYFKKSNRLYHISKKRLTLVKTVNDHKGFYFGVLNHR